MRHFLQFPIFHRSARSEAYDIFAIDTRSANLMVDNLIIGLSSCLCPPQPVDIPGMTRTRHKVGGCKGASPRILSAQDVSSFFLTISHFRSVGETRDEFPISNLIKAS